MHFLVFLLEVMHFFQICNFPWRYALLRFNFKQYKLEQCNIFWDTYINNSYLKECNFFFVCYATLNNTNLTLCNFELSNIFWGHLITQPKVLLYKKHPENRFLWSEIKANFFNFHISTKRFETCFMSANDDFDDKTTHFYYYFESKYIFNKNTQNRP